MNRRLQLKFFVALTVTVSLCLVCWLAIDARLESKDPDVDWAMGLFARLAPELLPKADASKERLEEELVRLRPILGADLSVYDRSGALLAAVGEVLPPKDPGITGRFEGPEVRPVVSLRLADGRVVVARPSSPIPMERPELVALGIFLPMVLLVTYCLVRWMTRRIETLCVAVDRLGRGELTVRLPVKGRDEISELAQGFNRTAQRIEELVGAQRSMLTLVSHELRSPLARLRMAIELLADRPDEDLERQARRDIAELDELIEQLLLASRLQSADVTARRDSLDLLALTAEEGARVDADVTGQPAQIEGDETHLRRMLRNLFENAVKHAGRLGIEARVVVDSAAPGIARVLVSDRGPGVPASERERIFDPFYRVDGAGERQHAGIGLGLSLVRQIARHHGGTVRCMDREGGGATFEVTLRLAR